MEMVLNFASTFLTQFEAKKKISFRSEMLQVASFTHCMYRQILEKNSLSLWNKIQLEFQINIKYLRSQQTNCRICLHKNILFVILANILLWTSFVYFHLCY